MLERKGVACRDYFTWRSTPKEGKGKGAISFLLLKRNTYCQRELFIASMASAEEKEIKFYLVEKERI